MTTVLSNKRDINQMKDQRPSWQTYFMDIARLTSKRSNCIKRKVGCIIVKDNRILSLGYNGTPVGVTNCYEGGCARCNNVENSCGMNLDVCMCLHAEENAMLFVSKTDLKDSVLYVTLFPCVGCSKRIIQCGIEEIVYDEIYNEKMEILSKEVLDLAGIKYTKY
jgi:dCMP deaminase